jgi:fumarate hydratase class I
MDLVEPIVELIRRMSCELPEDVVRALEAGRDHEDASSPGRGALDTILANVRLARDVGRPLCQDTGVPVFYVARPIAVTERAVHDGVRGAVREATARGFLRPNAVDPLTEVNSGDNLGDGLPMVHIHEASGGEDGILIDAMLKGGGCENVGLRYKLPDASLGASRDLDGVRRCVLDAVHRAQGRACPPYVLGVAVGGTRDRAAALAKRQLLRQIDDVSPVPVLARLEKMLVDESNALGIGAAGLGGRTTVLAAKVAVQSRHCACFYVEVSFGCWAMRRGRLTIQGEETRYE